MSSFTVICITFFVRVLHPPFLRDFDPLTSPHGRSALDPGCFWVENLTYWFFSVIVYVSVIVSELGSQIFFLEFFWVFFNKWPRNFVIKINRKIILSYVSEHCACFMPKKYLAKKKEIFFATTILKKHKKKIANDSKNSHQRQNTYSSTPVTNIAYMIEI